MYGGTPAFFKMTRVLQLTIYTFMGVISNSNFTRAENFAMLPHQKSKKAFEAIFSNHHQIQFKVFAVNLHNFIPPVMSQHPSLHYKTFQGCGLNVQLLLILVDFHLCSIRLWQQLKWNDQQDYNPTFRVHNLLWVIFQMLLSSVSSTFHSKIIQKQTRTLVKVFGSQIYFHIFHKMPLVLVVSLGNRHQSNFYSPNVLIELVSTQSDTETSCTASQALIFLRKNGNAAPPRGICLKTHQSIQRKKKKPSNQRVLNSLPLCYMTCALPVCHNRCLGNRTKYFHRWSGLNATLSTCHKEPTAPGALKQSPVEELS